MKALRLDLQNDAWNGRERKKMLQNIVPFVEIVLGRVFFRLPKHYLAYVLYLRQMLIFTILAHDEVAKQWNANQNLTI